MFHRSKRDNNRERRETNEVGRKTGECYCSSILDIAFYSERYFSRNFHPVACSRYGLTASSGFPSRLRHRTRPWLLPFKVARHFSCLNFFHDPVLPLPTFCAETIKRVLVHLPKRRLDFDQVSLLASTLCYLWRCANFVVNFPRTCGGKLGEFPRRTAIRVFSSFRF